MKQKNTNSTQSNDYATKQDLKTLETAIKKELKNYPTKDDLSDRLTASQNAFRIEIDHKFTVMRRELRDDMSKFTNLILTAIDPLIKDMETRRQESAIAAEQIREIRERLDDHDDQLSKIKHS